MKHKIFNQDCIEGSKEHFYDNTFDLIICDPPFGIDEGSFSKHYYRDSEKVLDGYVQAPDDYYKFSYEWIGECKRILKENGSFFIVSGWNNLRHIENAASNHGLNLVNHIIWKFNFGVFTKKKMVSSHYHILYFTKSKKAIPTFNTYCRFGFNEKTKDGRSLLYNDMEDVWVINKEYNAGEFKSINKLPEELIRKIIQYYSNEQDKVCDFFMGNFTTASVSIKMGRHVFGFELNKQAYEHFMPILEQLEFGSDLKSLKKVEAGTPENQGKKLTKEEVEIIQKDYSELLLTNTKAKCLELLSTKYGRGRWSLERIIKKQLHE